MSDANTPITERSEVTILSAPTPSPIQQWRNEDPGRRMYPNNAEFAALVPDDAFEGAEAPREQRAAAAKELRAMLADTGLSPREAGELLGRSAHAKSDNRSDDARRRDIRDRLSKAYGDPDQALSDAKKLINRDSRFSQYLSAKGLDRDPDAILILAAAARSQRTNGRLK